MPTPRMLLKPPAKGVRICSFALAFAACCLIAVSIPSASAATNLLKNPGFEEASTAPGNPPNWLAKSEDAKSVEVSAQVPHAGQRCLAIPAHTSVEQKVEHVAAGAYVARGWIKSTAAQSVTLLLQNPDRPWAAYTCTEVQVPANQWLQVESFCSMDREGPLMFLLGGTSKDFRFYHGTPGEMAAPVLVDDCSCSRYQ